jgi:hypothetical protein
VVEHSGRVLCSECLAKATAARAVQQRRWPQVRRTAALLTAGVAAWLLFYGLGLLLLKIPPSFHDGMIWTSPAAKES